MGDISILYMGDMSILYMGDIDSVHGRHIDIVPFMKLRETFVETLRVTLRVTLMVTSCKAKRQKTSNFKQCGIKWLVLYI
jgi:hypothetical protein